MKTKKTLNAVINLILLFSLGLGAKAQEKTQEIRTRPFQLSFVTPLGTNGLESGNITNNVSINLFAGYNGGLDGIEFSGFGSVLKNNMKGAQFSGFGNVVLGTGKGVEMAGFANINREYFEGVQAAGFANIIANDAKAWQLSGFGNITTGKLDGGQIAGFANYTKGDTKAQLSGFSNINVGNLKGVQITGFANINTGETQGVQIAGFLNVTKKLKGTQIGVFNYVDSLENGVPIGIFSMVKNGYRTFEISSSETLYGITSFKIGTERFYNIFSLGASYRKEKVLWGFGYGIGTIMPMNNDWNLAIELMSYQINEDEWFTNNLNLHNKILITTSKKATKNLNVFAGVSWNVNVSDTKDNDVNFFDSSVSPWNVFDKTHNNDTNVKMYPGVSVGIRF